jgi:hypothetical protein
MPLWLLSGLLGVRKAAVAAFGVFARYPWQTACIALLLASAWLWHGWDKADARLKSCEIGRVADRKAYTDAQATALVKAKAAKAATEKKYSDLAERTDADAQKAHDSAMAAAERYIAAHRLPAHPASQAGGPATPAEDHGAQGGDGSGAAPVVDEIGVSADDIRICTGNTSRLEAVRTWAVGLAAP